MEYVRLTKTLVDIGEFVLETEVPSKVNSKDPFYQSMYYYNSDGLDYFNKNKRIKGFKGEVATNYIVFDIDSQDLEVSRINMIRLVDYLKTVDLYRELASVISFSGSKGYHLKIKTDYRFTPKELKKFCMYVGKQVDFLKEAGFKLDSTVYNTNRIFRISNTINEKSGLYKVDITETDLKEQTTDTIKNFAKTQQTVFSYDESVSSDKISLVFKKISEVKPIPVPQKKLLTPKKKYTRNIEDFGCYLALQNGDMRHGESNSGLLRLAQFYKDNGLTKRECREKLVLAAHARMELYPDTNEISDEKLDYEILGCIYDGDGYTFTRSDEMLSEKCRGKCPIHNSPAKNRLSIKPRGNVEEAFGNAEKKQVVEKPKLGFGATTKQTAKPRFKSLKDSADDYKTYAKTINERTIKTGIEELDKYAKILPSGITFINAKPGAGKCLGPDVEVMKYDGSLVRADQIKKGDLLMGPDSKPKKVLNIGQGTEEMFRITPNKGESWTCNKSHILSLRCNYTLNSQYKKDEIYNISVEDYLALSPTVKHRLKLWRTSVDFKTKEVPFDPYLIGIWLAEGSVGTNSLHSGDSEVIREIENILKDDPNHFVRKAEKNRGCTKLSINSRTQANPFRRYVIEECYVDGEKRIPKECLVNDRSVRLRLLAGLLDGDGGHSKGGYEITTKYPNLAKDVKFLTRTLGFSCTSRIKKVKLKNWTEHREYVRMHISGDATIIPLKVTRKKAKQKSTNKNPLNVGFSIESIGEGEYYGVELGGDHLYLLGDTTVTHNTTIALNIFDNNPDVTFLFYCADMVESEFFEKVKSKVLKISPEDVRSLYSDNAYEGLRQKADNEIGERFKNVNINYEKQLTTDIIRDDLNYFKEIGQSIDCVVIDYVQKIHGGEDYSKNIENLKQLKAIQDEFKLPIVGLSQIPRGNGDEESEILTASAGKGGSVYEETASIIMNMWRPLKFCPEEGADNTIMVCIAKNRMGECPPPFPLHFNGAISEIRSKTSEEIEEFEVNFAAYQEAKRQNKKFTGKFR